MFISRFILLNSKKKKGGGGAENSQRSKMPRVCDLTRAPWGCSWQPVRCLETWKLSSRKCQLYWSVLHSCWVTPNWSCLAVPSFEPTTSSKPQLCLWQTPAWYSRLSTACDKYRYSTVSSLVLGVTRGEASLSKGGQSCGSQPGWPCIHDAVPHWARQTTPVEVCPQEFLSGSWTFSSFESYWIAHHRRAPIPQLEVIARWWTSPISCLAVGLKLFFPSDINNCSSTLSAPHASDINLGAEKERTRGHPFSFPLYPPKLPGCLLQRALTWCLSTAMAVRVKAETWREQYCANLLTWHIPFPKIQVLFTKRA